jgi:N-acetylglutamate synthase-like GNAT family acetyltransferase
MVTIREALQADWPRIQDFYVQTRYSTPIETSDRILIAETQDGIIAAVRICTEGGVHVLRGMRVLEKVRHQRLGTRLLRATEEVLGRATCYCVAYEYLEDFYGKAGFRRLPLHDAPLFLQERSNEYQRRGLKVIVMKRSS